MATYTGARGTGALSTEQRRYDLTPTIKLLQPDAAPFTTLLMELSKKATTDPKFVHTEAELEPRFDAINNGAGYASGITSIAVDNGSYFAQHDIIIATRTAEAMRVTAVSSNTLTVVRGVGSTAQALVDNDEILIAGSAQPEGDTSKPARSSNPTPVTGYTQIFRDPVESTNTAIATKNETTPQDWAFQLSKKQIEHKRSIERSFLFSRASEVQDGSQFRRTTAGLVNQIQTNSYDAAGQFTEAEFNLAMRQSFRYGSKKKMAMGSPLAVSVLNGYATGKVQIHNQSEKTYGMDVTTFTSPFGAIRLIPNWELEGARYGGYLIGMDMDNLAYRFLEGRDTAVLTNRQANDADTRKDEILTEAGLQVMQERTHFIVTGITS